MCCGRGCEDRSRQETRSRRRWRELTVSGMELVIHQVFLAVDEPQAALEFYRDVLGFEVRKDVGHAGMRWITVGPKGQPLTSIVLEPPAVDPGLTQEERQTIVEMM